MVPAARCSVTWRKYCEHVSRLTLQRTGRAFHPRTLSTPAVSSPLDFGKPTTAGPPSTSPSNVTAGVLRTGRRRRGSGEAKVSSTTSKLPIKNVDVSPVIDQASRTQNEWLEETWYAGNESLAESSPGKESRDEANGSSGRDETSGSLGRDDSQMGDKLTDLPEYMEDDAPSRNHISATLPHGRVTIEEMPSARPSVKELLGLPEKSTDDSIQAPAVRYRSPLDSTAENPHDEDVRNDIRRQIALFRERRQQAQKKSEKASTARVISDHFAVAMEKLAKQLSTSPSSVSSDAILQTVKDPKDPLRHMTPDSVWDVFGIIQRRNLIARLELVDWHRLLQNLVGPVVYDQPSLPHTRERTLAVLKAIKQSGRIPDAYVYTCVIRGIKDDIRQVRAVHQFIRDGFAGKKDVGATKSQVVVQKETLISRTLLSTLAHAYLDRADKKPSPGDVIKMWEESKGYKIQPSEEFCVLVLRACKANANTSSDLTNEIHYYAKGRAKAEGDSFKMTEELYVALIEAHGACKHNEAVERLFDEMEKTTFDIPFGVYKAFIKALAPLGKPHVIALMQPRMDRKMMNLDDECYAIFARSYGILGWREELVQRVHKRLQYRLRRPEKYEGPIRMRVYEDVLEAYAMLGDTEGVELAYEDWKRARAIEWRRRVAGVDDSRGAIGLEVAAEDGDLRRKYAVVQAIGVWSSVVRSYARNAKNPLGRVGNFFEREVFEPILLRKAHAAQAKKLFAAIDGEIEAMEEKIEGRLQLDAKGRKQKGLAGVESLKQQLNGLLKKKKNGVTLGVGESGVLAEVYGAFLQGWVARAEAESSEEERVERIMRGELFVKELQDLEAERVVELMRDYDGKVTVEGYDRDGREVGKRDTGLKGKAVQLDAAESRAESSDEEHKKVDEASEDVKEDTVKEAEDPAR
ncbi:hypothetical protein HDV00_007827 [Rhizophlyctis rosea]|nr:hypothetical protein HDV00_007827 [Rhizophlyctis rosea]